MPASDTPSQEGGAGAAPGGETILELQIERELQDSYLTYAMSTIMDRALPDVRDGLKPSQRRILVAMNDLNLRPGRKHLKCAKICGNTSGDYHPHGEAVIYPTLVGLAQPWRMRVPLVDGQGNFGSIDGDPPAAMRYTEARLTPAAVDMLADLDLDTVDFVPNYDDRLTEPEVLPGKFPNLLINGSVGIAVGMATSLPPHNPVEVLDAIVRVIERPEITLEELMRDEVGADGRVVRCGLKGPDFPTGGVIHGRAGIVEAYTTGRGRITVRGKVHVEEVGRGGERVQLVIDSIPYGVSQGAVVEKIVEAVRAERLRDVADVRNESGREAQTRVVIELRRGGDPRVVENQLYEFTPLQQTFSIMNIALVNRQPRTLTLRDLLDRYIEHRRDVLRRRTAHLLREARKEAHLLEGLIYAVCDIDEVIRLIRASRTREEAVSALQERRFRIPPAHPYAGRLPQRLREVLQAAETQGGVRLTRVQAERIGEMRLIQLVGLEIERLVADYATVAARIAEYEGILADERRLLEMIRQDCLEMRARYASPRLTEIADEDAAIEVEHLIRRENVVVTISRQGYAKRLPVQAYRTQGRGGQGVRGGETGEEDFIEHLFVASTHDDLLVFTDTGRVFRMKVYQLPEMRRTARGRALVNLISLRPRERPCAYLAVRDFERGSHYLTFVTRGGVVKRTPLKDYRNVHGAGIVAVGLRPGDQLLTAVLTTGTDDLLLVTARGMAIRFNEQDVRLMGRSAMGVRGIRLSGSLAADGRGGEPRPGDVGEDDEATGPADLSRDRVVGVVRIPMRRDAEGDLVTVDSDLCLLTICERGYGKRTPVDEYRVRPETGKARSQARGGKGRRDIRTEGRNGPAVAALGVREADHVAVATRGGQVVRVRARDISCVGRGTKGVRIIALRDGDGVVAAARIPVGPGDESDFDHGAGEPAGSAVTTSVPEAPEGVSDAPSSSTPSQPQA